MLHGVDGIVDIPSDRWDVAALYDPRPGIPGKSITRRAGLIEGIDLFDAEFFGLSPREVEMMDPQQRLLLEASWDAIEDGGVVLESAGRNTGVFVGISTNDYALLQSGIDELRSIDVHTPTGGAASIAANRVSYVLDLGGPSIAVDTACSSALTAIHLACRSLRNGDCRIALAGGVNAILLPMPFIAFSRMSMLSPDGQCKAFDSRANGFVRGEGVGVVALELLGDALARGRSIYAVIRGTAANQDGHTSSLTVPDAAAQQSLIQSACRDAGVTEDSIDYVEAHGTGTPIGDPIEANAIGRAIGQKRSAKHPLLIGSVKTNIGHLEAGAGAAGMIKAALSLYHGQIPPSLHFRQPTPHADFSALNLKVVTEPTRFPATPARVGVNSFGFGGSNAHAVVQSPPELPVRSPARDVGPVLLPLSLRSQKRLAAVAQTWHDFLSDDGEIARADLADVCHSAASRRNHRGERLALIAADRTALLSQLADLASGQADMANLVLGRPGEHPPRPVFVYSGQGTQWWAMGRELLATEPVFADTIRRCDELFFQLGSWSLIEELSRDENCSRMDNTTIAQPAIFAIQAGLTRLWESWGIRPAATVGHSVGEVAAAWASGVLSFDDAARVIFHRGRCMEATPERGRMMAVAIAPEDVAGMIAPFGRRVTLAAVNSSALVTLAGEGSALETLAEGLQSSEIFHRFLNVQYAFHSDHMDPVQSPLLEALGSVPLQPAQVPVISTVTGQLAGASDFDAGYWWRNVREPVLFGPAIERMVQNGFDTFLEVGPHPALTGSISDCLRAAGRKGMLLSSLRRGKPEREGLLRSLGMLHVHGHSVDWEAVFGGHRQAVRLPRQVWQRERFWHESDAARFSRTSHSLHPLLEIRDNTAEPTWQTHLDVRRLSWLADHRVQGHAVFPAAGYLDMMVGAAEVLSPGTGAIIEDAEFRQMLVIPEGDHPVRVELRHHPSDGRMEIWSCDQTGEWSLNARGTLLRPDEPTAPSETQSAGRTPAALRECVDEAFDTDQLARFHADAGLEYGPAFRGLNAAWRRNGEAIGRIEAPESVSDVLDHHAAHPCLLDACFQLITASLPRDADLTGGPFLPVQLDRFRLYKPLRGTLWCHVQIRSAERRSILCDMSVTDPEGTPLARIEGFRCQAVSQHRSSASASPEGWLHRTIWRPQPRKDAVGSAGTLATQDEIAAAAHRVAERDCASEGRIGRRWLRMANADMVATDWIVAALRSLGWTFRKGSCTTVTQLGDQLGIVPAHRTVFSRFLTFLAQDGVLSRDGETITVIATAPCRDPAREWAKLLGTEPALLPELSLVYHCGMNLADVLRGRVDSLDVLFSDAGAGALEHLYQSGLAVVSYNVMLAEAVSAAISTVPHGRPLRVLEIGAGTGGLTAHVLPRLPADTSRYVYTDLSPAFFRRAEKAFFHHRCVEFATLDIERDPTAQGFEPGSFDIVLASDALHAARDVRQALTHATSLLASGGLLGLIEITRPTRWADMVFGLTAGWWRFDDDLRTDHPAITADLWKQGLSEAGLSDVRAVEFPIAEKGGQVVLLARRRTTVAVDNAETVGPRSADGKAWLIVSDQGGVGEALANCLLARGDQAVVACPDGTVRLPGGIIEKADLSNAEDGRRILNNLSDRGLTPTVTVFLSPLDAPAPDSLSASELAEGKASRTVALLALVQRLTETETAPEKLIVVTRGTQAVDHVVAPVNPTASLTWGLSRVIVNEYRTLNTLLIDLDPRPGNSEDEAQSLLEEIEHSSDDGEIALRGGSRYVSRVLRSSPEQLAPKPLRGDPPRNRRLEIPAPGMLDKLAFVEHPRRSPGPGEVEIEVHAAAINFRDIMKALGIYPIADALDELPGDECAGLVTAVGEGVTHVAPGDAVLAMGPGCFGSHVLLRAGLVFPKPKSLDFEEAVTLPVPFLTAWHALHEVGRMSKGETVLIHAATGGVGLAAIQVAREGGARVFATAGSSEKRAFLTAMGVKDVMNSRSLSFAEEVRHLTSGRGVDLVLNSLAGRAIEKGLSALAPGGRFLEIGKRDIYQNNSIGLRPFRNNISFHAIDLHQLMTDWSRQASREMQQVIRRVETGRFTALPHRVFPMDRAIDAFRHMSQARHIGKVVLSTRDLPRTGLGSSLFAPDRHPLRFRADASYLITGGLSGFGLAIADWLVKCGARHLVLVSRQGPARPEAQDALTRFRAAGVTVLAEAVDVANPADLDRLFSSFNDALPPIRGIFHAAMVLDDAVISSLTPERLAGVTRPKVAGAWLLHQRSLTMELDYFVLFSSVSALVGSSGQANYVAANAFLVSLAHYRRGLGLPALAVDWGRIADAGHVERSHDVAERLNRLGLLGMPVAAATEALERVLSVDAAHLALIRIDWATWSRSLSGTLQKRFSEVAETAEASDAGSRGGLRDRLMSANESERAVLAVALLREQVGSVLRVSPDDLATDRPLSELGLDSLVAIDLVMRLESAFDISVATGRVNSKMTIEDLAAMVVSLLTGRSTAPARSAADPEAPTDCLVNLRSAGDDAPLFLIHPGGGEVSVYSDLVAALPLGRPVIAVESRTLVGRHDEFERLSDMIASYAEMIASRQPEGPLHLAGFSFGGHAAFAIAKALELQGRTVAAIGVLDSDVRLISSNLTAADRLKMSLDELSEWAAFQGLFTIHSGAAITNEDHLAELVSLPEAELVDWLMAKLQAAGRFNLRLPEVLLRRKIALRVRHIRLLETHAPLPVAGSLLVVSSRMTLCEDSYWRALTTSELRTIKIDCMHFDLLAPPAVGHVSSALAQLLDSVNTSRQRNTLTETAME